MDYYPARMHLFEDVTFAPEFGPHFLLEKHHAIKLGVILTLFDAHNVDVSRINYKSFS